MQVEQKLSEYVKANANLKGNPMPERVARDITELPELIPGMDGACIRSILSCLRDLSQGQIVVLAGQVGCGKTLAAFVGAILATYNLHIDRIADDIYQDEARELERMKDEYRKLSSMQKPTLQDIQKSLTDWRELKRKRAEAKAAGCDMPLVGLQETMLRKHGATSPIELDYVLSQKHKAILDSLPQTPDRDALMKQAIYDYDYPTVRYHTADAIIDESFRANTTTLQMKTRAVVILDDMGREYLKDTERVRSAFDKVIDLRYANNLPTIITTNLTTVEFRERYGDRIYDRLRASNQWHETTQGSLR